jgi:acetyltransferase-like isoleucine patch superfamily enzyme
MYKCVLLQCKFILVQFLNVTHNYIPLFIRRYYLSLFNLKIGKNSTIHREVKFFHLGNFSIGYDSTVNFGCYLDNRRGIYIGNNVGIAHNTKIYTLGHKLDDPMFCTEGSSVKICDHVFIFSNCLIMPGVTIHEGAIVLAGSVVTKDVEPFTIVGGNPAKLIRERSKDLNYNQRYQYLYAL